MVIVNKCFILFHLFDPALKVSILVSHTHSQRNPTPHCQPLNSNTNWQRPAMNLAISTTAAKTINKHHLDMNNTPTTLHANQNEVNEAIQISQ